MEPTSREELIDWCLRRLGQPVIVINVADEQIEDRVDEALQYWREFHGDATVKDYYIHPVTQTDKNNKYITLPTDVLSVTRVLPQPSLANIGGIFNFQYQFFLNDFYRPGGLGLGGNMSNVAITMSYLDLIDFLFNQEKLVRWNRYKNQLNINMDWDTMLEVGSFIVVECQRFIDPDTSPKMWGDYMLKRLTTALIKLQWGENISKFRNVSLPGGVTLNGMEMKREAQEEVAAIRKEMQDTFQDPIDFMVG